MFFLYSRLRTVCALVVRKGEGYGLSQEHGTCHHPSALTGQGTLGKWGKKHTHETVFTELEITKWPKRWERNIETRSCTTELAIQA